MITTTTNSLERPEVHIPVANENIRETKVSCISDGRMHILQTPFPEVRQSPNSLSRTSFLAWFWRHQFQTSHPLAEARLIKVNKIAFQLHSLFRCQSPELGESRLLQQLASLNIVSPSFLEQQLISLPKLFNQDHVFKLM